MRSRRRWRAVRSRRAREQRSPGLRDLRANGRCRQGEGGRQQSAAEVDGHTKTRTKTSAMPKPSPIAVDGAVRRRPAGECVEGSLFNLKEKVSCRFSADAGSGNRSVQFVVDESN